jgi:hypothetical protein
LEEAQIWLGEGTLFPTNTQIGKEIDYFFDYYETLAPKVFLSYERDAYYSLDGSDFRVTFDENILAREEELSLACDVWGEKLIDDNMVLMEIKTSGGYPLWMTQVLSQQKIYKISFSKIGTVYESMIMGRDEKQKNIFIA